MPRHGLVLRPAGLDVELQRHREAGGRGFHSTIQLGYSPVSTQRLLRRHDREMSRASHVFKCRHNHSPFVGLYGDPPP
jgi:hypothetical protein